jgi:hypothetical protein
MLEYKSIQKHCIDTNMLCLTMFCLIYPDLDIIFLSQEKLYYRQFLYEQQQPDTTL